MNNSKLKREKKLWHAMLNASLLLLTVYNILVTYHCSSTSISVLPAQWEFIFVHSFLLLYFTAFMHSMHSALITFAEQKVARGRD